MSETNEIDYSQLFLKYKVAIISAVLAIFILIIGAGIYSNKKKTSQDLITGRVEKFQTEEVTDFIAGKMSSEDFHKSFLNLFQAKYYDSLATHYLVIADQLMQKNKSAEALLILEEVKKESLGSDPYVDFLLAVRLAALYEDAGRFQDVVTLLEKVSTSSIKLMGAKLYIDIGRAYLKLGKTEKAQKNFNYVVENFTDEYFVKLAKLYLAQ